MFRIGGENNVWFFVIKKQYNDNNIIHI
jgi:hypothetical protein